MPIRRSSTAEAGRRVLLVLAWLGLIGCGTSGPAVPTYESVTLAGKPFQLELALDTATRVRGLSDRASIPADGGMIFVFPAPQRLTFVMRRCLTPIDLVFVAPSGRIDSLHEMKVEPYDTPESRLTRYSSRYPCQFAIELAGGTIRALGLQPGQVLDLPWDSLKDRAR